MRAWSVSKWFVEGERIRAAAKRIPKKAVAPTEVGAGEAASAAAAEAAARGTPFDGEAEAIAQARREADDELRTLGGCTTPEELEAARAAYERAHPGVFVRKEQGLLLRADVPFPAADRYAAVNFASL